MNLRTDQLNNQPPGMFLSEVVRWSWIVLAAASFFQVFYFWDLSNTIGVAAVTLGWLITVKLFFRPVILNAFPFSTFLIIGFASTQFYFPLTLHLNRR